MKHMHSFVNMNPFARLRDVTLQGCYTFSNSWCSSGVGAGRPPIVSNSSVFGFCKGVKVRKEDRQGMSMLLRLASVKTGLSSKALAL